jgi:porin-like protein
LTTAWNVNAAYEHFWNPRWRTSLYGGYAAVSYGILGNALLCAGEGGGTGTGMAAVAFAGCDNNWSTWWIGSRTQWNVTKDFYMGLDVMYSKLSSASLPGSAVTQFMSIGSATTVSDVDNWQFRFRVHRDFYP